MQTENVKQTQISTSPLIEKVQGARRDKPMQPALHISTKVLPGKKIEISTPDLSVGDAIEVFIIPPDTSALSCRSVMNMLRSACSSEKRQRKEQQMLTEHSTSNSQSEIAIEVLEVLEAIKDYLSPEPGSPFEEMLNDALEGRIRLEAMDIQDTMLLQHHAKKYVQRAIATLKPLSQR